MSAAALDTLPRRAPPDPHQVHRCLLLAVLLHVWLVLVLGNATGSAAPGQGVWGSLTVKLMGRSGSEPGAAPGEATPTRSDNAPATDAGAATAGRFNPREVPPEAARTDDLSAAEPSTATLTLPEGFRPVERERLDSPPPRRATEIAPLPAATAINRLEARPDAPATTLPSPAELRAPAPARTAELPLSANPPAPVAPTTADLPAPVRRLELPADTAVTTLPRAADLRPSAATATPVAPPSADLPAPVRRLEAPATDRSAATSLPQAADLRAVPSTSSPAAAATTATDLPAPVRRLEAADDATAVTPLQPAAGTRPAQPSTASQSIPELSRALPGAVAGAALGDSAADRFAAPKAAGGSPDAGPRLGANVPSPSTAAASAPRAPLNLSLPRGDMTSRRGPGLVELLPPPPERKSKLEQSIEDAVNKDCRKAYAENGLLAAVPLAIDAARGKGCKW